MLAGGATQVRAADVDQDRDQPAADGGRLAQFVDPSHGDHERVLDGVVGVRAVAEHPDRDRVQARTVPLQQHAQARRVAGLCSAREGRVVGPGHDVILMHRVVHGLWMRAPREKFGV